MKHFIFTSYLVQVLLSLQLIGLKSLLEMMMVKKSKISYCILLLLAEYFFLAILAFPGKLLKYYVASVITFSLKIMFENAS